MVADHHSAAAGCRVLPVIMEEEPPATATEGHYHQGSPPETRVAAERRKAIVAMMRELLSRAAAAQAAHSRLRRSTVATARKWKVRYTYATSVTIRSEDRPAGSSFRLLCVFLSVMSEGGRPNPEEGSLQVRRRP
jgi:hypothetical protein